MTPDRAIALGKVVEDFFKSGNGCWVDLCASSAPTKAFIGELIGAFKGAMDRSGIPPIRQDDVLQELAQVMDDSWEERLHIKVKGA